MKHQTTVEKNEAVIIDLLHQVRETNKMIDLHQKNSGDDFMVNQYEAIRERFLSKLRKVLSEFDLGVFVKKQEGVI